MNTDLPRGCWRGAMVWDGRELATRPHWLVHIQADELAAIGAAVRGSIESARPIAQLSRTDFNFGPFTDRLLEARAELLHGRGFVVLRGLDADDWNDEMLVRAYWGIGCWLGDAVSQNARGDLIGHVIDQRRTGAATRIYQTNQPQPFHSDSCDIVGLLCLRVAKSGGDSALASSAAIYNYLHEHDRQALDTLFGQFDCDRYGEIPDGKQPSYPVRVFNIVDEQLVCCGMDPDIRSAQRLAEVARLSVAQLHALDRFQQVANTLALNMTLQRGDLQLVNNHTVVHARTRFQDHQSLDRRRYLVRLWLSSADGRRLPAFLAERWGNIAQGTVRGGIQVAGVEPQVRLDIDPPQVPRQPTATQADK